MQLYDVVKLKFNLNNIRSGSIGTIIEIFEQDGNVLYLVEFCDKFGRTIDLVELKENDFHKLTEEEIKALDLENDISAEDLAKEFAEKKKEEL